MPKFISLITAAFVIMLAPMSVGAATYYVDAVGGNDAWNGTDVSTLWKTLSKVGSLTLNPGDKVLLHRNIQFRGKLHPGGSGSTASPVVIGAYGTGNKPVILGEAMGKEAGTIRLMDRSYYLMQDLEIQSPSDHGIVLHGCSHVTVQHCDLTNVAYLPPGMPQGNHEAWAIMVESGSTDGSYNIIDHCTFKKCSMGVIIFAGDNIVVQNSYFYLINGLGAIFAGHCVGKTRTNSRIKACMFDYTDVTSQGWNPAIFGGIDNCYKE